MEIKGMAGGVVIDTFGDINLVHANAQFSQD